MKKSRTVTKKSTASSTRSKASTPVRVARVQTQKVRATRSVRLTQSPANLFTAPVPTSCAQYSVPQRRLLEALPAKCAAFLLVCFFVLVPIADVRASEDVNESSAPSLPSESTPEPAPPSAAVKEDVPFNTAPALPAPSREDGVDESPTGGAVETTTVPLLPVTEVPPTEIEGSETTTTPETIAPISNTPSTLNVSTSTAEVLTTDTTGDTVLGTPEQSGDDVLSTTTPLVVGDEPGTDELGTTTEEQPIGDAEPLPVPEPALENPEAITATTTGEATTTEEVVMPVMVHRTQSDQFSFGETECVPVGNGAFHCVKREEGEVRTETGSPVKALRDEGGDLEIIYSDGARTHKITDNDYDDDAPSYDAEGEGIVWHALIDERYQIMSYDIETGETLRLTGSAENSMQPASYDDVVVFQEWIGEDWEIALIDQNGELEYLTDNDAHDIAPSITDEYITWQSDEGGEWVARIMDRKSGDVETVRGVEGGKVANPRMILVFDSTKENGDIETVGYDPRSGTVAPLGATPSPLPERIPEPEQEQEEKALIQPTTTPRIETKASSTPSGADDSEGGDESSDSSTPEVSEEEIIISPLPDTGLSAGTTTTQGVVNATPENSTPDLTLDLRAPLVEKLPPVPDLVIPERNVTTDETASST